ncbi:unnamed protein product [Brassicogethes aeneus]|uniref:Reverse transcriptase domain-containing protein n=1 Tax=Brassicogethes aeneus TaxID=1431903 RepID=A0A9P0FK88_BRAAE|nr:unnamed protein product [Brassicogethes aeneus]
MTLSKTSGLVKINGKTSKEFQIKSVLRQGDPLSTVLFNLVLEKIIRDSRINRNGSLFSRNHQCLAYADDVVLMARTKGELQRIAANLINMAEKMGLRVNYEKSKYMNIERGKNTQEMEALIVQTINGVNISFEEVESYMYLGVLINNKGDEEEEINLRELSLKVKIRMYKTIIRPTVLYACETSVLNRSNQIKLEIWERKILRRIFGGKKVEEGWIRRTNAEIYDIYKEPIITEVVKSRRIQWLGHLERMDDHRLVKGIGNKMAEGKRRKGRPRKKWMEEVLKDLKEKKIVGWKTKAKDRKKPKGMYN